MTEKKKKRTRRGRRARKGEGRDIQNLSLPFLTRRERRLVKHGIKVVRVLVKLNNAQAQLAAEKGVKNLKGGLPPIDKVAQRVYEKRQGVGEGTTGVTKWENRAKHLQEIDIKTVRKVYDAIRAELAHEAGVQQQAQNDIDEAAADEIDAELEDTLDG